MKKYIIITTIFSPSEAVKAFSGLKDYNTIVVGDKKSPANYNVSKATFLSVEKQTKLGYQLNKELPYNHYSRKNIGYLYAIQEGADIIIDTDDDNIPYKEWTFPPFEGEYGNFDSDAGFINIYNLYSLQNIWPRGLPLDKIKTKTNRSGLQVKTSNVGIWQALADGDPDVDAIYRLVFDIPCYFEKLAPVVLGNGTITPINSQNTAFKKDLFPLLYLPSTVTFRFTDILRGLVAQPIMWLYNYSLGITQATVYQERNPHNNMKDFESEIPCFLRSEEVIDLISNRISASFSIYDNLLLSYEELYKAGIVLSKEIELVEKWIIDLQKYDQEDN